MKFRLLRADEIDVRISICNQYGVGLLLYKDARCDQNILDETVGSHNWQRRHTRDNANCIVSIWDESKKQWIEKEDTGTESFTEKEKGLASDSFKRACFNWGIGRELYTAPDMFVLSKDLKTLKQDNGRWTCRDRFKVTDIQYIQRNICYVKILNEKTGKEIEFGTPKTEQQKQDEIAGQFIDQVKINALLSRCKNDGIDVVKLEKLYKVGSVAELTEKKYSNINVHWQEIKEQCKRCYLRNRTINADRACKGSDRSPEAVYGEKRV